jgi:hypothetical protein
MPDFRVQVSILPALSPVACVASKEQQRTLALVLASKAKIVKKSTVLP